jgi:hypothetical protein
MVSYAHHRQLNGLQEPEKTINFSDFSPLEGESP